MKTSNIINLLKWDITINWKQYGWRLVGALGWFLVLMMLLTTSEEGIGDGGWLKTLFLVLWGIQLTDISSNLENKVQRIHFLTLPASMNEKLLERITICLILWPLALLATIFTADILHVILSWALDLPNKSFCSGALFSSLSDLRAAINVSNNLSTDDEIYQFELFGTIFLLYNIVYGFMCGCLWTRRAFLKSIGLGLALGFGVCLVTALSFSIFGMEDMFDGMDGENGRQMAIMLGYMFYWLFLGMLVLATLLYAWIGYHTYTTREVIDFGKRIKIAK